jgi:GAF domain-containing protein/HAMP domain-containing protein
MDKSIHTPHQAADSDTTPIKFWGTIVANVLASLLIGYYLINIIGRIESLIGYVAIGLFLLFLATALSSIVLTIRGRQELGSQIAFYAGLGTSVTIAAVFQGRTLSASVSYLLIGLILIFWLLPEKSKRRNIIILGAGELLIWGFEWINPSWRLASEALKLGFTSAIILGTILAVLVIRQSWRKIISSIRIQITLWIGLLIVILSSILVTYSVFTNRQAAIESAKAESLAIAQTQAENVTNQVAPALDAARTLAHSLGVVKDPAHPASLTRDQANAILRKVAEENPAFLGTWTIWEPNAFDGLDAQFINAPLHDYTGRFIPYWVRVGDTIHGEAVRDYETPGLGDFYIIPKQTKTEMLISPFYYEVGGKQVLMTSLVVPIVENDRFYGVTGVDLKIDFVQGIVDKIDLYNGTATAVILTDTGTLIAVRNQPDQALQPAAAMYPDFEKLLPRIAAGETFTSLSPDGEYLRVFAPINIGETGAHSSLSIIIPFSSIIAPATESAVREIAISLGVITVSLLAVWLLLGQLVRPIIDLTATANAISAGNLNAAADTKAPNETGILAKAFNSMTTQLRNMLDTLEQRVAARTRNLELAAEVGRAVSQVRELDVMLKDACELILKEFNLYYVQVYLTSSNQKSLNLEAGTGEVGAQLVRREHRLPFDVNSINGRAAVEKRSVVISDTTQSATFRQNPLLPETRGEMAIPLIVADKVVGVLDMQSREADVLNEEILPAFEALAGQLAVAIQNANLLKENNEARAEVEKQARRLVRKSWNEYMDAIHTPEQIGFKFDQKDVVQLVDSNESKVSENAISSSISVTGEPVGSLTVQMDDFSRKEQALELINAVAQRMAQQIENLRLLENAERYRQKAESVVHRTTLEGWRQFMEMRSTGKLAFRYDTREVQPISRDPEGASVTFPIKTRDQAIGKLSILDLDEQDSASLEIVDSIMERLGDHIESLRQYDQTQSALAQSKKLFDASQNLTQAADLQELISATLRTLGISAVNRALLTTFSFDSENEIEQLTVVANWWNGEGHEVTPVGTRYSKEMIQLMPMFVNPTPLFFNDTFSDERVDEKTREFVKRLNLRAVAVLPLHLGTRQVGALFLEAEDPHYFTPEEIRLFISLAPQIATVLENRQQYEMAQRQAEREAMLNAINQKIQSATSVEAVLQIAARELGRALDASKAVAQLRAFKRNGGNGNNGNDRHP